MASFSLRMAASSLTAPVDDDCGAWANAETASQERAGMNANRRDEDHMVHLLCTGRLETYWKVPLAVPVECYAALCSGLALISASAGNAALNETAMRGVWPI